MPDVLHIDTLLTAQAFINGLQEATHETSGLPAEAIHRLRHPLQAPPIDLSNDEALRQSIALWVKLARAPENTYDDVHGAVDSNMKVTMKSKKELEKKLQEMTGMYPQRTDMCIDSCVGFAGAYANDVVCPKCRKARWDEVIEKGKKVNKPRKQYLTNPIGPQIQAAWASPESARDMSYRKNITPQILAEYEAKNRSVEKLSDWVHSSEYIEASQNGKIDADTTTLLLSLDGAQLYRNKESDCWIYIWILMDRSPENRYKKPHLVVGGIIPGPHKPKDIDSFLFPGFQHLAALMKEGLMLWDASTGRVFRSKVFLAFATADGPGMQFINGLVGHSGRRGCRLYCDIPGRRKPTSGGHYYPALKKPKPPYNVPNSMHDDIDPWQMPPRPQDDAARQYKTNLAKLASATTAREYEKYRLETGIAKLSLVSGLPSDCIFGIPNCFPPDIMHLAGLNIPDILIALWRATLSCDAPDSKDLWDWAVFRDTAAWKAHGRAVAAASAYLPGSFDRMPRDIAEKLTSGYKATEHLIHLYGFCPALLYGVLPEKYWQHLCKLARALRLVYQRWITKDQLAEAHTLLTEYVDEYEDLYYQREPTRIHLVRQSIHALLHVCPTTYQIGPYAIVSQFPLERMIGDLGQDIRLDSNPYGNLAKIAERRCILNALRHMYPQFADPTPEFPTGAAVLGNGYALLRKRETTPSAVTSTEAAALRTFIATTNIAASSQWLANPFLARWARLRLPNGQTARSRWRDGQSRPSRQVKVRQLDLILTANYICTHMRNYPRSSLGKASLNLPRSYTISGWMSRMRMATARLAAMPWSNPMGLPTPICSRSLTGLCIPAFSKKKTAFWLLKPKPSTLWSLWSLTL